MACRFTTGRFQEGDGEKKTGISFATPIAAGIAACVLEFACINDVDNETYKKLRCRSGMRKVFAQKLADHRQELHYIHPWKLFGKGRTDEEVLNHIANVFKYG